MKYKVTKRIDFEVEVVVDAEDDIEAAEIANSNNWHCDINTGNTRVIKCEEICSDISDVSEHVDIRLYKGTSCEKQGK
jgi:hypothetical protein